MTNTFEQLERTGFAALNGSTATLRLVIDEAFINELVTDTILPRYPAIRDLRFEVEGDNHVTVRVRSSASLIPELTLQLEIERVAILPGPTVRLRIRKQGSSSLIASLLPAFAHKLPPQVRLSGEIVEVDVAAFLDRWRSILALLVRLEIETSPQQLHVALELRV